MKDFIARTMLLLNKVDEGAAGGGPSKDFPVPPKSGEQPPPKADQQEAPAPGDKQFDELGYEIVPQKEAPKKEGAPAKEGDKSKETPAPKPEKVENPGTGYGDEPPPVEDPPAPEKKDPPAPPTELEKKLEGLEEGFAARVKAQITELGLEGDKLEKFISLKKQEQKEANDWKAAQEIEMRRQDQVRRNTWHKELKEDPAFGGEKYAVNLSRSEKVLDEYLPELKKELTEAKQILRPSVMRGLARLADTLYPDRQMAQGDPPAPEKKDDGKAIDPLAFYE